MTLLGLHRPDVVVRSPPAALRNAAPALGRQPGRWGGGVCRPMPWKEKQKFRDTDRTGRTDGSELD